MENRIVFEMAFAEHARRVARASQEGWRRPERRDRSAREQLAMLLLAWAARLTPALPPPGTTGLEVDGCACCAS
jgi:hypothetical protein